MASRKEDIVMRSTELKQFIKEIFNPNEITEEVKQDIMTSLVEDVLPTLEKILLDFNESLEQQSKSEGGWKRIRDGAVLPYLLLTFFYIANIVAKYTYRKTKQ